MYGMVKIEAYLKDEENFLPSLGTKLGTNENQVIGFKTWGKKFALWNRKLMMLAVNSSKSASTSNF